MAEEEVRTEQGAIEVIETRTVETPKATEEEHQEYVKDLKSEVAKLAKAEADNEDEATATVNMEEDNDAGKDNPPEGGDSQIVEADDDAGVTLSLSDPAPTNDGFDLHLIAQAKLRGLSEDEAKSFGSPEALVAALNGTPSTTPDDTSGQDSGHSDPGDELGLDPDEVGQDVADAFAKATAKIKALEEQVAGQQAAHPQANADEHLRAFNQAVAGLGDGYAEVFGEGDWHNLEQGSREDSNRMALAQAMDKVILSRQAVGESTTDANALAEEAIRKYFPDLHKQVLQGEVTRKVSKRAQQAIHRPSGTHMDPDRVIEPEQLATNNVQKLLDKMQGRK